jgi:uncharacterized protein (UPF0335 family)
MDVRGAIKSFIERVLLLKAEQDALADDIREVYAEAKGSGFDKTVLGQLVAHIRKREKDPNALAERSALFDVYLSAYDSGTPVATRVHAHEPSSDQPRVSSGAGEKAVAASGEADEARAHLFQAQRDSLARSTAPAGRAAEKAPAPFTAAGDADDVASTESRRDEPHQNLAAGDESPLLSEPVAFSRETVPPVTDAHGFMVDDMPAFLERASA